MKISHVSRRAKKSKKNIIRSEDEKGNNFVHYRKRIEWVREN